MTPTEQTKQWLEKVVIGLNLCPFAKKPHMKKQIRIQETHALKQQDLLMDLAAEIELLEKDTKIETSILVITQQLEDFYDYNDFLDTADQLIDDNNWRGEFQVASFHPDYQFAGTDKDDAENLTNRSPFPLLHILRESSLDIAVETHPDVDQIPEDNIQKMRTLSVEDKQKLFSYLPE
ncbi:DUF1415 domain-containing protein [Catenovulum maritimum]|uniref:Uncharacterized protein n=1 Tax=Catenovulum maritimum TaxID=1513271 RepID=A0A0J8JN74_9ALTE|nr:DUF1415 domain-containing protein [Catenovulum maritimum]KMT66051.1 hypothetical protein XM47_06280 [Catenovulum maritimum]